MIAMADGIDYGFGSISSNFGSSNLDNIPSSGGSAGYTSARSIASPSPVPGVVARVTDYGAMGNYDTTGASSAPGGAFNPVQSGDTGTTLDKLIALYGNQFAAPSQASTSGGGVVVVPQATGASAAPSAGVSPQVLGVVALAVVGYFAWRMWHNRGGA